MSLVLVRTLVRALKTTAAMDSSVAVCLVTKADYVKQVSDWLLLGYLCHRPNMEWSNIYPMADQSSVFFTTFLSDRLGWSTRKPGISCKHILTSGDAKHDGKYCRGIV